MRFPLFLPALVFCLALAGCADRGTRGAEVDGFRLLREGGDQRVEGILVNTGTAPIGGANLTVALYGAENNVLGEVLVSLNADLAAGERTSFEQELDVDFDAQGARVRRILVY